MTSRVARRICKENIKQMEKEISVQLCFLKVKPSFKNRVLHRFDCFGRLDQR